VDRHINQIQINVVTGFVHVEFEERSDIFIRVWDNSRSRAHVNSDTFDSGVAINNTSIIVHSVTPAFNCHSCHHAKIEIFIPIGYPQELLISGNVKVGMVHINGKQNGKNKFVNIDVNVELGKIVVEDLLSNSLSLTSEIGLIEVYDVIAQNINIQSHTAIIRTYGLSTKNFRTNTRFGCSKHYDLNAEVANLNTRFGFSSVVNPNPLMKDLDIHMNTEYGKAQIVLDSPSVTFNLGTTKGQMTVEYEDEVWICNVTKSSHSLINGQCNALVPPKSKNLIKLDINTKYGSSNMIVDHIEEDDE